MDKAAYFFNAKYNCVKNCINRYPLQAKQSAHNLLLFRPKEEGFIIQLQHKDILKTRATIQELKWECNYILTAYYFSP